MGIGEPRQIPLAQNRCAEARFGENHHASRALDQVRTRARAHHQKERIGHAAVQPHDGGETAEHLPRS